MNLIFPNQSHKASSFYIFVNQSQLTHHAGTLERILKPCISFISFFKAYKREKKWVSSTVIFLGLIWGRMSTPSQFKIEQKLPKMVHIIPNYLVLQFSENFMEFRTKIVKLQTHANLHKNVNENMFSFTFLCNIHEFL